MSKTSPPSVNTPRISSTENTHSTAYKCSSRLGIQQQEQGSKSYSYSHVPLEEGRAGIAGADPRRRATAAVFSLHQQNQKHCSGTAWHSREGSQAAGPPPAPPPPGPPPTTSSLFLLYSSSSSSESHQCLLSYLWIHQAQFCRREKTQRHCCSWKTRLGTATVTPPHQLSKLTKNGKASGIY